MCLWCRPLAHRATRRKQATLPLSQTPGDSTPVLLLCLSHHPCLPPPPPSATPAVITTEWRCHSTLCAAASSLSLSPPLPPSRLTPFAPPPPPPVAYCCDGSGWEMPMYRAALLCPVTPSLPHRQSPVCPYHRHPDLPATCSVPNPPTATHSLIKGS